MIELTSLWSVGIVGPIFLLQTGLFLIAAARLGRTALRLLRWWRPRVLCEALDYREVPADRLATLALTGRLKWPPSQGGAANQSFTMKSGVDSILEVFGTAEREFRYIWGRCHTDVHWARRTSVVILLLSLITFAYNTFPILTYHHSNGTLSGSSLAFVATQDLCAVLGHAWTICVVLYFASSALLRTLDRRQVLWAYLLAKAKDGTLRDRGRGTSD